MKKKYTPIKSINSKHCVIIPSLANLDASIDAGASPFTVFSDTVGLISSILISALKGVNHGIIFNQ